MVSVMAGEAEREAAKQLHDELLPKMPKGSHDSAGCVFCSPRETAAEGATVAPEAQAQPVDLNDPAIKAVVDHRVATETASLTAERDAAVKERDDLQTKLDVVEGEKAALTTERDTVKQELESERARATEQAAAASRRDSRKAQLVEKIPHLDANDGAWFTREVAKDGDTVITALDRIAAMDDERFTEYAAELASAFDGVDVKPGTTTPPRETAMQSTSVPAGAPKGADKSAASSFIGRVSFGGGIRR